MIKAMKELTVLFLVFFLFLVSFFVNERAAQEKNSGVYIVYVGAVTSRSGPLRDDQIQLLSEIVSYYPLSQNSEHTCLNM